MDGTQSTPVMTQTIRRNTRKNIRIQLAFRAWAQSLQPTPVASYGR